MKDIYAPIIRAQQIIQAVYEVVGEMPLTPLQQALVEAVFIENAKQTAIKEVSKSLYETA